MEDPQSDPLYQVIFDREVQVWQALVSGDMSADRAALADDFLGVYPDGFAGKADHVGQLANGPSIQHYDITDARLRRLGGNHALLSYRATFLRVGRTVAEVMYVSSIWRKDGAGWINIFSQDTAA